MNGSAYSQERSEDRQLEHIGCFSSHCTLSAVDATGVPDTPIKLTFMWRRLHSKQPLRDFLCVLRGILTKTWSITESASSGAHAPNVAMVVSSIVPAWRASWSRISAHGSKFGDKLKVCLTNSHNGPVKMVWLLFSEFEMQQRLGRVRGTSKQSQSEGSFTNPRMHRPPCLPLNQIR